MLSAPGLAGTFDPAKLSLPPQLLAAITKWVAWQTANGLTGSTPPLPQQALMPPLSLGYVSLIGMALMAPLSVLMAPLGARIAHALSKRQLEVALGIFLLLVAGRFVVSLI